MLDKKALAKVFFFAITVILLTGFNLCIIIYCRPSSLLSFILGGVTFSTVFALLELIAAYLEDARDEKFR